MTLKLTVVLRLSGRIQAEGLDQLREQVSSHRPNVLDLAEVMLVDVAVIRFLIACPSRGHRADQLLSIHP